MEPERDVVRSLDTNPQHQQQGLDPEEFKSQLYTQLKSTGVLSNVKVHAHPGHMHAFKHSKSNTQCLCAMRVCADTAAGAPAQTAAARAGAAPGPACRRQALAAAQGGQPHDCRLPGRRGLQLQPVRVS